MAIYWLTGTAGSAARFYRESGGSWGEPVERSKAPAGVAAFAEDASIRRFAEREHTVVHWSDFDEGGHVAALQAPGLLVDDVRLFFRGLR